MTPAFSGQSVPILWPQNQAKEPKLWPQSPSTGKVEAMGLQTGRSQPTRSQRGGQGGRFPCPLRGLIRPKPPRSQYWLPPFRGPPRLAVWSDTPRSSPSRPGQPSVRQSVPNSVHTQRLPAPAGSSSSAGQEVWPSPPTPPPRTHPLSRFQVGRGPPSAGFRPQEPLAGRTRGTEFRPGT